MNNRYSYTALHDLFGIEVHDVDLTQVTKHDGYPQIRSAFEEHSLLLFRNQALDERDQRQFARLFGALEPPMVQAGGSKHYLLTNRSESGRLLTIAETGMQQNLANQLWHTDSTFLPVPALANVLCARVVPSSGGETEFVSTRVAWSNLSSALRKQLRHTVVLHSLSQSRRRISERLAKESEVAILPPARWRAVWPNPNNGREALYIASHAFGIEGMEEEKAQAFIEELIEQATPASDVYTHRWRPGDVLVWDERATMHRGRPWPAEEERTLTATVISASKLDGVELVTPPARVQG